MQKVTNTDNLQYAKRMREIYGRELELLRELAEQIRIEKKQEGSQIKRARLELELFNIEHKKIPAKEGYIFHWDKDIERFTELRKKQLEQVKNTSKELIQEVKRYDHRLPKNHKRVYRAIKEKFTKNEFKDDDQRINMYNQLLEIRKIAISNQESKLIKS